MHVLIARVFKILNGLNVRQEGKQESILRASGLWGPGSGEKKGDEKSGF